MKTFILAFIMLMAFSQAGFAQSLSANASGWNNQVQDESISSELKIYPNPCKESKVTIELSGRQITEIRLINITGKEILLKTYTYPESKKQIELSEIPNGIYIIRIKTDDQSIVTKKLMVSKN